MGAGRKPDSLRELLGRLEEAVMDLHYQAGPVSDVDASLALEMRRLADQISQGMKKIRAVLRARKDGTP